MTTLVPDPDGDARVIAEMPDLEHTPAMDSGEAWVSDIACVRYYCGGILIMRVVVILTLRCPDTICISNSAPRPASTSPTVYLIRTEAQLGQFTDDGSRHVPLPGRGLKVKMIEYRFYGRFWQVPFHDHRLDRKDGPSQQIVRASENIYGGTAPPHEGHPDINAE